MKKIKQLGIIFLIVSIVVGFSINYVFCEPTEINAFIASKIYKSPANSAFSDENFYKCVMDEYNSINKTSHPYTYNLSDEELQTITNLNCFGYGKTDKQKIKDTDGLEKLVNLTSLYLTDNLITRINLKNNIELREIWLAGNQLTELDVSNNSNLIVLDVGYWSRTSYTSGSGSGEGNLIETLNISNNTKIKELYVTNNKLTELDVSNNLELKRLDVEHNQLTKLDVNKNKALTSLNVSKNQLTSLDVSKLTLLTNLDVGNNFGGNQLTKLDVSNNVALTSLFVARNQLSELDVSNNTALTILYAYSNQLTELDISNNMALTTLYAYSNQLTELDVSNNPLLKQLEANNNQLTELDVSNNSSLTSLNIGKNQLSKLDISNNMALTTLYAHSNQLTELDVSNNPLLKRLEANNNQLTELDVSNNSSLTSLNVCYNQLATMDISNNASLTSLSVCSNQLTELDVSNNSSLTSLNIGNNQLTILDISNNVALTYFDVSNNQLTNLDVSNNASLATLYASNNHITNLDISNNASLKSLTANSNQLTELDVSNNTLLTYLIIGSNPFGEIYYVYKGNNIEINDNVKIPNQLNWSKPIWGSSSVNIATVDQNRLVSTPKSGNVNITGRNNDKYTITNKVNVVEITSDKYRINEKENYIYIGSDNNIDTIKENINISHEDIDINVDIDNNKLQVKHDEDILKEFKIIKISSKEFNLTKEYIYVSNLTDEEILSKINTINSTKTIEDNKLLIKYNNILLDEYKLIRIIDNGMPILDNDKMYISNKNSNKVATRFNTTFSNEVNSYVLKDKIDIEVNKEIIGTLSLLSLNLGNLKESSKMIVISEEILFNDFISNISLSEGLGYKILNGSTEVAEGSITKGMVLKIYYNDIEVDSFDITDEYVYIHEDINVDDDNGYLSNIEIGTKVSDILNKIDTSGTVTITNNKNEIITGDKLIGTGTKISIKLNTKTIEYTVIIQGDIDGDGKLQLADIMKLANYIYKDKTSLTDVYLTAADYDGNGTHHLQDIMKIANKIYGNN